MEEPSNHLICSYRPLKRQFHPSVVRPVFDKVRVVRTLCPKEYPEQIFIHAAAKVDTDPHEDHGKKLKHPRNLLCELVNGSFSTSQTTSVLRCITFEMEIEVSFENPSGTGELFDLLESKKPSIRAKMFDWPRLDSDQPICDLDLPYQKLRETVGITTLDLCEILGKLRKVQPLDHKIVWKYDPLRETSDGPNSNVREVHKHRLESILAGLADKYRLLQSSDPETAVDLSLQAGNYSSYWFWKWRVHALNGLNLISKLKTRPDGFPDFLARIRPILMLLRDILTQFQVSYIQRLVGLELSATTLENIKTYTGLLDRVNDLLASDLDDISGIEKLLKQEMIKLGKALFCQDAHLVMPKIYSELETRILGASQLESKWPIMPNSNCVHVYEPDQQVFLSIFLTCLQLSTKFDESAKSQFLLGDHRTLNSSYHPEGLRTEHATHKDFLFRMTHEDLQVWKLKNDGSFETLQLSKTVLLAELLPEAQNPKIVMLGSRVVVMGLSEGSWTLKCTKNSTKYEDLQVSDFKDFSSQLQDGSIPALDKTAVRFECSNNFKYVCLIKAAQSPVEYAMYCLMVQQEQEDPQISPQFLNFGGFLGIQKSELISVYLTKRNYLLTFFLEDGINEKSKAMNATLSAFRVTTESLELSFSTKIELECIGTPRKGTLARRSARFFTALGRLFFIFSLSIHKYALFTVHNNQFCRVSGGKTSDESPVYSYPALASMCESRDKRGHPGNSLYFGGVIKQTRVERGEYQLYRLRLKL